MKKPKNAIWFALLVAALGVVIGFLGELMPDHFKNKVESLTTQTFGISYLAAWIIAVAVVVLLFLWLVWKEARRNDPSDESTPGAPTRKIRQGKKSVYIEKNDGPINIK